VTELVQTIRSGPVATLAIDRQESGNSLDGATIAALHAGFRALASDPGVRAVVLTGVGDVFCSGLDRAWVRASLDLTEAENQAEVAELAALFEVVWRFPKPLLARVNGPALGSGCGLVACCDLAIAAETSRFGFDEVKLGLSAALFSPYVVPKIGYGHTRALLVTGERFSAERAFEIGLVHAVTPGDELDVTISNMLSRVLTSAPQAVATTKAALEIAWDRERSAAQQILAGYEAETRTSAEAQEGLRAAVGRRRPSWTIFE
jgi:methylglutaconyl-CoA hydratase